MKRSSDVVPFKKKPEAVDRLVEKLDPRGIFYSFVLFTFYRRYKVAEGGVTNFALYSGNSRPSLSDIISL